MLKNTSIKKKILAAFLTIAFLATGIVIFALMCMNTMREMSGNLYSESYMVSIDAMTVRNDINKMGKDIRNAYMTGEADKYSLLIDGYIKEINENVSKITELATESDMLLVNDFNIKFDELIKLSNKTIDLIRSNSMIAAQNEIMGEYDKAYNSAIDAAVNFYNVADSEAAEYNAQTTRICNGSITICSVLLGIGIAVTILLLISLLSSVIKPLKEIEDAANQMAKGSLKVKINYTGKNEIGTVAESMRIIIDGVSSIIDDMDYLLSEMADGNFDVKSKVSEKYIGDYTPILTSLRNINTKLSDTLYQINNAADQVTSSTQQVSEGSQELSQGATQQASAVEELAATLNDVSERVSMTAESTAHAKEFTDTSGKEVDICNEQMNRLVIAMNEITSSSTEIGKIIKTIEDIAFQTNILALNAAVEAARAGAAGKGFAVVADEVRNLASKSAEASKNTAALIENSIRSVEKGMEIANSTAETLGKVVKSASNVVDIVDRISEQTNEQAASISQIAQGIDQISSVIQTNSATAEESAAASEELSAQSDRMRQMIARFKFKNSGSRNNNEYTDTPHYIADDSDSGKY